MRADYKHLALARHKRQRRRTDRLDWQDTLMALIVVALLGTNLADLLIGWLL